MDRLVGLRELAKLRPERVHYVLAKCRLVLREDGHSLEEVDGIVERLGKLIEEAHALDPADLEEQ